MLAVVAAMEFFGRMFGSPDSSESERPDLPKRPSELRRESSKGRLQASIICIQSLVRVRAAVRELEWLRKCATAITALQAAARGRAARHEYVKLDALYLAFRHYRLRARVAKRARDRRRQAAAATALQARWRGHHVRKPSPLRGVRYGSAPWSVQIVPVNQPGVSALEEPSGWATGWEWLDTLDAGEREWLLRALWFNCDEVRIARMPRITTRRGHYSHSHSRMLTPHTPPAAGARANGADPPRRGGARGERHADRRVRRDRAHAAAAARYGGA